MEEEHDHEPEIQEQAEPIVQKPVQVFSAPKETERQLSKKEKKKKELEDLDALLADMGVNPKEKAEDKPSGIYPCFLFIKKVHISLDESFWCIVCLLSSLNLLVDT